jgi:hypothetical protein
LQRGRTGTQVAASQERVQLLSVCSHGPVGPQQSTFADVSNTPLRAIVELVHELHGTQRVYECSPLSEEVEVLGYLWATADADPELHRVLTADLGTKQFQLLGKHWEGFKAFVHSRGEQWVRSHTNSGFVDALRSISVHQMSCITWV